MGRFAGVSKISGETQAATGNGNPVDDVNSAIITDGSTNSSMLYSLNGIIPPGEFFI